MHSANNHNIHIEHQKNSLNKILSFPVKTLKNSEDLQYFHELVQDTEVLSWLIRDIYEVAEDEKL